MKSTARIVIALLLLCAAVLSGCQSRDNGKPADVTTPEQSVTTPQENTATPDPDSPWTLSDKSDIRIGDKTYCATSYYQASIGTEPLRKIVIAPSDSPESKTEIQLGAPQGTIEPLLFSADVNFDGFPDLLVLDFTSAYGDNYTAIVWDKEEQNFVRTYGFEKITNFTLVDNGEYILGKRGGDMSEHYSISVYNAVDHAFVRTNYLRFTFPYDGEENISVFEEHVMGCKVQTDDFTVPDDDAFRENPKIQPYYEAGSTWDLNAERWNASQEQDQWHERAEQAADIYAAAK